jgi:hypothetical protein
MKKFTMVLDTTNAAFEADGIYEIERIMKDAMRQMSRGKCTGALRDYNGNTVGSFELQGDK